MPAKRMRGLLGSIATSEQPAFSSTNSVRCPRGSAVGGAKHAALRLRPVRRAERAGDDDVRILWIDDHARRCGRSSRGPAASRSCPRRSTCRSLADRDVAPDHGFAGARPDDVRGRTARRRASRSIARAVRRRPGASGRRRRRLPHAARGAARVIDERISGHTGDGRHAVAFRPDETPPQLAVHVGAHARRLLRRTRRKPNNDAHQHGGDCGPITNLLVKDMSTSGTYSGPTRSYSGPTLVLLLVPLWSLAEYDRSRNADGRVRCRAVVQSCDDQESTLIRSAGQAKANATSDRYFTRNSRRIFFHL